MKFLFRFLIFTVFIYLFISPRLRSGYTSVPYIYRLGALVLIDLDYKTFKIEFARSADRRRGFGLALLTCAAPEERAAPRHLFLRGLSPGRASAIRGSEPGSRVYQHGDNL